MARILFFAPFFALIAVGAYFLFLKSPPPVPKMDLNAWWGPKDMKTKQDKSIRNFKIKFDEVMIADLKARLKNHRTWTPPLEGVGFEYGFNSEQMEEWTTYWMEKYNFKEREAALNQFPQFKTNIQGLDIHFIRVKPEAPKNKEIIPLLLLHGWPGSVREFYEAIPILTEVRDDRDFAVEVIVPSLPGYGFSDAAVVPGLGAAEMAVVFRNLMHRLKFKQYYVQGGDWGALIGANMATIFPDEVLGFHTNMPFSMAPLATVLELLGSIYPPLVVDKELEDRMYPIKRVWSGLIEESGYMHLQATKPDTLGVALSDSPSGLLAYILEKFSTWTNLEYKTIKDGGLTKRFTKDKLIDNLMFYWTSRSITTSMRLYAENFSSKQREYKLDQIPTKVPTWAAQARYEIAYQPPFIIKLKFPNLVNATVFQTGGHFLAFEMPKEFSEDVLRAITEFRKLGKKDRNEL